MKSATSTSRWLPAALAALFALLAAPAWAELKVGYVNAVKVIEEAPQGEAALKKLEAEFGPRDKKLVAMQGRIKQLEDELEKNALLLKDTERRSKEHEIVVLKRDLRRATQEFREDYNLRRNEELASLQKLVFNAIVEIAKQESYDLILHEGTIYASKKVDLTEKVLKRLGKK
ncbi:membrane protein [Sulfurifustis variabilis]|uniref:Membrane protein n=1 Tax=Sulfurifustis variabilis TaxID=1675686 RepID=A0A1B4V483_9GAMM|nr:OmpH family outer membrane protein [Sulfurifustis variabilis]BAU48185.1 membrane protein [Sulfurifustis variabilis]